jgi:hypothetical protein
MSIGGKKNMKKGKRMKEVEAANKKKKEEERFKLEGYLPIPISKN